MSCDEVKMCATCGRSFPWQHRWARCWDQVRYCSADCREQRPNRIDRTLEDAILGMLACGHVGATICPSEAALLFAGPDAPCDLEERTRRAARRLAAQGKLEITQEGRVVDPTLIRGPIRVRLPLGRRALRFQAA